MVKRYGMKSFKTIDTIREDKKPFSLPSLFSHVHASVPFLPCIQKHQKTQSLAKKIRFPKIKVFQVTFMILSLEFLMTLK